MKAVKHLKSEVSFLFCRFFFFFATPEFVFANMFPVKLLSYVVCFVQVPGLCEDLLSSVDQPLKIARDKVVGKDYLLCDYNRDGDSYRSSIKLHSWSWKTSACFLFFTSLVKKGCFY